MEVVCGIVGVGEGRVFFHYGDYVRHPDAERLDIGKLVDVDSCPMHRPCATIVAGQDDVDAIAV